MPRLPLCLLVFCCLFLNGCNVAYGVYDDKRLTGTIAEDKSIATAIKTDLLNHNVSDGWDISVYCYYGHVFLVGEAPAGARNEALTIARRDARVRSVRTHWFKPASSETSDMVLAARLRTELISASNLSSTRIDTKVNSGRVVLLGVVANDEERALAVRTAKRVEGVVRVDSYLMLPGEAVPAAPRRMQETAL